MNQGREQDAAEGQPDDAGQGREQQSLGQAGPDEGETTGAEGEADGGLASVRVGASEHQTGDIDAGQHEYEGNAREEHPQQGSGLAEDSVTQG